MNKKPHKQAGPGKVKRTNSPQISGAKIKLKFPAPKKKVRKSILTTWPNLDDPQSREDFEWRMGL